jgi:3-methylfumaryl-CoA hydratase
MIRVMENAIGRQMYMTERLDAVRAQALHATLGLRGPAPKTSDPLPPLWHYMQFWDIRPDYALGRDGHPKPGHFLPDTGLPRRMWAGGELTFHQPLILGQSVTRCTTISNVRHARGKTGPLVFVSVDHRYTQNGDLCLTERQNLLYRADFDPMARPPVPAAAPEDETTCQKKTFSTTTLFRYSALTFNGHRIHYDRDYAREIEGYPGLVVHGPLMAQMLVQLATEQLDQIKAFSFRATAPLFDFETAQFCAKYDGAGLILWVRGPDGRLCMTARAC